LLCKQNGHIKAAGGGDKSFVAHHDTLNAVDGWGEPILDIDNEQDSVFWRHPLRDGTVHSKAPKFCCLQCAQKFP